MQKSYPLSRQAYLHFTIMALLVILCLAIRFLALNALKESIYFSFLMPDEQYYHDWATDLLKNKSPARIFEYAPLPAYLLAFLYKITSVDINIFRVFNIFLNTFGCISIYFITKTFAGRNWSLLALAIAACSRELVFYSVVPLKTSLSFFLFAILTYLVILSLRHFSRLLLFFIGCIIGLSMMVRPNVLMLLPVVIATIIFFNENSLYNSKKAITLILIASGFICSTLPLPLHNYSSSKQFTLLPIQSGFLFYCTNNITNPTPFYSPVSFASSHPEEQGIHFTIEASKRTGKVMVGKQASRYWQLQVVREAIDNPFLYLNKLGKKALMLLNFSENGDHYNIGFISGFIPLFKTLPIQYCFIALIGFCGLVIGFFHSNTFRCLLCITLAYLTTLVLYSTGNRFNMPLLTILIPTSIWLCRYTCHLIKIRNFQRLSIVFAITLILIFTGRLNIEGAGDLSQHYNTIAFIYNQNRDSKNAVQNWEKSKYLKQSYSDIATLFLSGHYYQQFGPQKAIETLHSIPDTSFMSAAKYLTLGDIHLHHKKYQKALHYYQKSLDINSGQLRARKEIISILKNISPKDVEKEVENLSWIQQFYR